MTLCGRSVTGDARLAYVSFDDRYFLLEVFTNGPLCLIVYDRMADAVLGGLDTGQFVFYDEAVFTRDNFPWVRATDAIGPQSFRYTRDFSVRTRPIEGHHHAHGFLPNGVAVGMFEASNRNCPPGSASGVPGSTWKPTAVIVNELIDTTGAGQNQEPLASVLLKLGCKIPGQHEFSHPSWNNTHTDRLFSESWSYSGGATDPIADSILRIRFVLDPMGFPIDDQIDIIARHRSEKRFGYFALPRVSCNQQGTRCAFSSSMTVGTTSLNSTPNLYVVNVP